MAKVIGIDLGTTNSVCAVIESGESKVIISEEGGRVTPSVVGFAKDGTRFVGDIAKRQLLINPSATVHSLKRFIGKTIEEVADQVQGELRQRFHRSGRCSRERSRSSISATVSCSWGRRVAHRQLLRIWHRCGGSRSVQVVHSAAVYRIS